MVTMVIMITKGTINKKYWKVGNQNDLNEKIKLITNKIKMIKK